MRAFTAALLSLCALSLSLCCTRKDAAAAAASTATNSEAPAPAAAVRFETPRGTWVVRVELARTPEERARGLMYRRELAPDTGMLFVFDEADDHSFWMRNTLLSLDMIFLGDDRSVVGVVANAPPRTDKSRSVGKPSRYVLEVAGGEAFAHAVGPGARAVFVGVAE
jgi:uncharacterized membrane protein (UPF0127 family)